ncbi:MAG: hypothetical protein HY335_09320 [Deinococcus sp.]|nr:hypothetical protein [Deinococcus sp.]
MTEQLRTATKPLYLLVLVASLLGGLFLLRPLLLGVLLYAYLVYSDWPRAAVQAALPDPYGFLLRRLRHAAQELRQTARSGKSRMHQVLSGWLPQVTHLEALGQELAQQALRIDQYLAAQQPAQARAELEAIQGQLASADPLAKPDLERSVAAKQAALEQQQALRRTREQLEAKLYALVTGLEAAQAGAVAALAASTQDQGELEKVGSQVLSMAQELRDLSRALPELP